MSILSCSECGRFIDSDDDPECFKYVDTIENGVMCEICREIEDAAREGRDPV